MLANSAMTDRKLARRLGRSMIAVRVRRVKLRIPFVNSQYRPWRPADDQLLGKRPDEQIALLLGKTVNAVKCRRIRLGIVTKRLKRRQ
jgi:hypothetical protein